MKIRLLILLLVAAAGAAGFFAWREQQESRNGSDGRLTVHGHVAIREVPLAFRVGGRIARILMEEGQSVEPGDLLARLDPEPIERQLIAARARLRGLEADLGRLRAGFRPEEVEQAEAQVRQRQAVLFRTERELRRHRELGDSGATSAQDVDRAVSAQAEAEAALALAEANLHLLQAGFREEEIAAAAARVEEARAEISRIELQIDDTALLAPAVGIVLVRALEPGAMVSAGQTVFSLSLFDRTWVRAYIEQSRLGRIRPGQEVEVFTDSRPGTPYRGHIGFIASRAEFTPRNVETAELRTDLVFRFRVILDEPEDGLRQGMPVTVRIAPTPPAK